MRDYIISFELDGKLSIYTTNKELLLAEVSNFKMTLLEYVLIALAMAFMLKKGYQVAEVAINRKIVI